MRGGNRCRHWLLVGLWVLAPAAVSAQDSDARRHTTPVLDRLVREATGLLSARYTRPLGHVVERQRGRIFVAIDGDPPELGDVLAVTRPVADSLRGDEIPIAQLQVSQVSPGMVECREINRSGKERVQRNDSVRAHGEPIRVLLAPCTALLDLPAVLPEVVGEKLRAALRRRRELQLAGGAERESLAVAAYASRLITPFLQAQEDLDEVLFPVLLRTPEKIVLNVECFSVTRARAVDIAVASVDVDDMLRSWFTAATPARGAPPGFRLLAVQEYPWDTIALVGTSPGTLLSVSPDSLRILEFEHPGLRPAEVVPLGAKDLPRRAPYALLVGAETLRASKSPVPMGASLWVLSEERWPRAGVPGSEGKRLQLGPAGTGVELRPALEALWKAAGGPADLASRWWPAPGRGERPVIAPLFADLDGDGRMDLAWSDRRGTLLVQRSSATQLDSYRGFGDVKAVQPGGEAGTRTVFWLTDPVCCDLGDRLHAAQLEDDSLRLVWSSTRFTGTLTAVASHDLNGDGAFDVVAAEHCPAGTRLHVYLALPSERTAARGLAWKESPTR